MVEPQEHSLHLRVHGVEVMVRDPGGSLEFYVGFLGFHVLSDFRVGSGRRIVALAPPDGTSIVVLREALPDTPEAALVGRHTGILLVTNDIAAQYAEWTARGVRFSSSPTGVGWNASMAVFHDIDGNVFHLLQSTAMTEQLESERRAQAEREQQERQAAREMEIARQVQARLFPQVLPRTATLACAGTCIPALHVGGDYYDVLELDRHRLAIVIGDVAGKGIPAALLMANLQAGLRSRASRAAHDISGLLEAVNQSFFVNSPDASYTTLFYGVYDDETGRLTYVNCGHLPPLLVRASGEVERLGPTCAVLGIFEGLVCESAEAQLADGDLLVLYTDGVTEARDANDEEFGDDRIVSAVAGRKTRSVDEVMGAIVDAVGVFSDSRRDDDLTVLVVRRTCRTSHDVQ